MGYDCTGHWPLRYLVLIPLILGTGRNDCGTEDNFKGLEGNYHFLHSDFFLVFCRIYFTWYCFPASMVPGPKDTGYRTFWYLILPLWYRGTFYLSLSSILLLHQYNFNQYSL